MAYDVGVQSFTYREFDFDAMVDELEGTPVTAVELYDRHLGPDDPESEREAALERLADAGIEVCGYGVHGFEADDSVAEIERVLDFAADIGVEYVSIDVDPDAEETIEALVAAAADRDLDLGIHNHGPDPWSTYETVEDVLEVVEGHPVHFGACVDTGHFFRVDQTPEDVVPALGERVHAVHVKDFADADTEVLPGDANLDIPGLVELLDEHTDLTAPLVIEYELDEDDPTPAILEATDRLLSAQD